MSRTDGKLHIVGATDRGRLRSRNEDSVGLDTALGAAVVADGMGGLPDGHVASREAVDAVLAHLRATGPPMDSARLEAALRQANERVRARASQTDVVMGTTAVLLGVEGRIARVAHVGDSRAYHYRRGHLAPLTRDHSMVQDMVERGLLTADAARHSPQRNVITRALGLDDACEVEVTEFRLAPGELVVLCSDGLWDMLEDRHIGEILAGCGTGDGALEDCLRELIDAANAAGGLDNISVVLARS